MLRVFKLSELNAKVLQLPVTYCMLHNVIVITIINTFKREDNRFKKTRTDEFHLNPMALCCREANISMLVVGSKCSGGPQTPVGVVLGPPPLDKLIRISARNPTLTRFIKFIFIAFINKNRNGSGSQQNHPSLAACRCKLSVFYL